MKQETVNIVQLHRHEELTGAWDVNIQSKIAIFGIIHL